MTKLNFDKYELSDEILKAISLLNFHKPTKVQKQVIPAVLKHKDIVVKSQTGSGKTAAFAIPICEKVLWDENMPQALVVTPTRELATQVKEDIFNIGRFKRIKVLAVYGKSSFQRQEKALKQKTHVVVGTPGRIIDHLQKGTLDVSKIGYLVIDEADKMLNMGFVEQLEEIITRLPEERVNLLLSATLPKDIEALCYKYMNDPIQINIEDENSSMDRISQERFNVKQEDKMKLLGDITILENPDSCIIFCNTKQKVDEVSSKLKDLNYSCDKIHGDMEQKHRLRVMNDFKRGYFRYLIATDVAARGIDVNNINLVINYDIPFDSESYVHRIGRTGRKNNEGRAITFVTPDENKYLDDIQEYINRDIALKEKPDKETIGEAKPDFLKKINTKPKIKEDKGAQLNKEIMKLHINAGKKTKMRPVDIVGTLCNIEGVTAEDIGIINIIDVSTFVEVLNNKGEIVLEALQTKPIKGRIRKVSKANR
ncbi:MAG: DEAD/DEAH box helicase [Firmicutes bacterium]|nr:DEAD/DEAH box helicase [Bacillota bacterium]